VKFARAAAPASRDPVVPRGRGIRIPRDVSILSRLTSNRLLVSLLIFSLFLDSFRLPVGNGLFNVRPSFVVFAAIFPAFAYRWFAGREPILETPLLPALVFLDGLFFFSTLINPNAPYHVRGLISSLLLLINIAMYLSIFRFAAGSAGALNHVFSLLAGFAAVYALFAALTLALFELGFEPARHLIQLSDIGDLTMNGGTTATPHPLLLDPNMGSYLGAIGVMALIRSIFSAGRARLWLGLASAVIFLGVLLSYSRGAWLAAGCGLVAATLILVITRQWFGLSPARLAAVGAIFVLAIAGSLLVAPSVKTVLAARVANLLNIQAGTGSQRLGFWEQISEDGLRKPLLGHGSDAYRALLPSPPPSCRSCGPYVAENITVEVFHTSGFVGLAAYLALQVVAIALLIKALRRSRDGTSRQRGLAVAASAGYITIVIASQTNPSFWGNMYWALLAVVVASAAETLAAFPGRHARQSEVGV